MREEVDLVLQGDLVEVEVRSGVVIRTDCIVGTVGGRLESSNRSVVIHVVKMLSDDCECQSFGLYTH